MPQNMIAEMPAEQAARNRSGRKERDVPKITAAQSETNCPTELQNLGARITVHLDKARKCEEKAEQHYRAMSQHLAQAKEVCDTAGFNAFRKKFCPDLGKSRAYELLAIATNKKSVQQIKAETRERVARCRANKARSVTVAEDIKADPLKTTPLQVIEVTSDATDADNQTVPFEIARQSMPDAQVEEVRDRPNLAIVARRVWLFCGKCCRTTAGSQHH